MSVFAATSTKMFDSIPVTLRFTGRLAGGAPKDPKLIEGWLRKNLGISDESELRERVLRHLAEMGAEIPADASYEQIIDSLTSVAGEIHTQGFKRTSRDQPYIESRQIKAGIKESVNILFATGKRDERWGPTKKGPLGYTAERVFVKPDVIVVADEISGSDLNIGHINGPSGPQSTLGYYEYVDEPVIEFEIRALGKAAADLTLDRWAQIWSHMEYNGLGAMRSQGFGQFEVIRFGDLVDADDEIFARERELVAS